MGFSNLASSAFLLISFLLAHLPLLHSSQPFPRNYQNNSNCFHLFDCSSFRAVGFPFANTTSPECGVITLNCTKDNPKVQLQKGGRWFDIEYLDYFKRTIKIHDPDLQNKLKSGLCDSLNNFTAQGSSVHFEPIGHTDTLTFLKCKRDGSLTSHSKFFQTFRNFTGCKDYDLFFYGDDDLRKSIPFVPETLSNSCSVVQLPVYKKLDPNLPIEKLESLFADEFSLYWTTRQECIDCHWQGRHCADNNRPFECEHSANTTEWKKGSSNLGLGPRIGIGAGIIGTLILGVVIIFDRLRRKYSSWNKKAKNGKIIETFLKNHGTLTPKRYNYSDIKKMTNSFKEKLGQGGYGRVFKGKLLDGRVVAVKVLSETKGNGEEFINEVASICRTSHVNIVTLFGFCVESSKRALVYEFMPNGSLEKFIYDEKSVQTHPKLGWEMLYKIAIGIARGLEYLHRGCNTRILHFDIKPHNILLDQDFCPKISDFGLAKLCLVKESIVSMMGARGTPGYIAPELFSRNFGGVSHKSDVYSYGMMVLEMVGRRKNIDARVSNTSEIYFPHWIYKQLDLCGDVGLHDITTAEEKEIVWKMIIVGLWCIQINPLNRPPMSRVLEMLEGNLEVLEIPPKPFLTSPPREQEEGSSIS